MRELCSGFAAAYGGVEITLDNRNTFDVLINDEELSKLTSRAAKDIVGKEEYFRHAGTSYRV